jgi:hypothetical protein
MPVFPYFGPACKDDTSLGHDERLFVLGIVSPFKFAISFVENISIHHVSTAWYFLLLSSTGGKRKDLLRPLDSQDAILQSALPLVFDALDLVVRAQHDLVCLFAVLRVGSQVVRIVKVGIDGVLVLDIIVVIACRVALSSCDAW